MNNLTTKQKIILGVIICAMLIVIGIYGYILLNQEEELDISELANSFVENEQSENQNEIDTESNNVNSLENGEQTSRTRKLC